MKGQYGSELDGSEVDDATTWYGTVRNETRSIGKRRDGVRLSRAWDDAIQDVTLQERKRRERNRMNKKRQGREQDPAEEGDRMVCAPE